jgi:hypothetical protein
MSGENFLKQLKGTPSNYGNNLVTSNFQFLLPMGASIDQVSQAFYTSVGCSGSSLGIDLSYLNSATVQVIFTKQKMSNALGMKVLRSQVFRPSLILLLLLLHLHNSRAITNVVSLLEKNKTNGWH